MSNNNTVEVASVEAVEHEPVRVARAGGFGALRRGLERGLATVEYAVGIVLVLTVVGALIWSAQQGWFKDLVKVLFETIFRLVTQHLAMP